MAPAEPVDAVGQEFGQRRARHDRPDVLLRELGQCVRDQLEGVFAYWPFAGPAEVDAFRDASGLTTRYVTTPWITTSW